MKDYIYAFSLLLILGDFPVCFTEFLTAGSLESRWDNSRDKYELNQPSNTAALCILLPAGLPFLALADKPPD